MDPSLLLDFFLLLHMLINLDLDLAFPSSLVPLGSIWKRQHALALPHQKPNKRSPPHLGQLNPLDLSLLNVYVQFCDILR